MAREVTRHGMSGYRLGCRCEDCRRAKREYMRDWRARRREAEIAAALADAEPLPVEDLVSVPLREPVAGTVSLDMACDPGPLERALLADLAEPDDRVAFRRHLVGIGLLNARVLDQIGTLDRLDLISPVQLRQLEILQRLAILGFAGMDKPTPDGSVAEAAAQMLRAMEDQASGDAGG